MNKIHVLVANDDVIECSMLCRILQQEFQEYCHVLQADSATEVINLCSEKEVHVALVDVSMSEINGLKVAQYIAEQKPQCITVFLASSSDFLHTRQLPRLKALDYLTKPYSDDELFSVLDEAFYQIQTKIYNTSLETAESYRIKKQRKKEMGSDLMEKMALEIVHFISQNYMKGLSMQDMAQFIHYSDADFCQFFKEAFGCNFTTYITRYRIKKAEELLKNSLLLVEQIAQKIGYSDTNYFIKVFKRHKGIVPIEYRTRHNLRG